MSYEVLTEEVPTTAQWRVGSSSWRWIARLKVFHDGSSELWDMYLCAHPDLSGSHEWDPTILCVNSQKSYACTNVSSKTGQTDNEHIRAAFLSAKQFFLENWWQILPKLS